MTAVNDVTHDVVANATADGPADVPMTLEASIDVPLVLDLYLLDISSDDSILLTDGGKYLCKTNTGFDPCQCNDGIDNDADMLTDYPSDPGCLTPWDNSEPGPFTECTDGIDNDGDGKIDAVDPECTGPWDNDESSFGIGIPDADVYCQRDCFFDWNGGPGDDDCRWNIKCDPAQPALYLLPATLKSCTYDPTLVGNPQKCPTNQSQTCLGFCLPITPNGCDCFGCCAIPTGADGGALKTVMLRNTCKMGANGLPDPTIINDPYKCPPCTQVPDCLNSCDKCEVCVGKPSPDPTCVGDGGAGSPCTPGTLYCGPGGIAPNACPTGTYCISGCCM